MINIRSQQRLHDRSAFTLIELLIVITIITIILTMTLATVKFTNDSDRVSGAASAIQSFMAGARDRAIYSREKRGVRLFVEPPPLDLAGGPSAFGRTVTSMAYIAPGGTWGAPEQSSGIDLLRVDRGDGGGGGPDGDYNDAEDVLIQVRGSNNPGWWNLKRRGWLVNGLRMRIPAGPTGNWYSINTSLIDTSVGPTNDQLLLLNIPYADGGNRGEQVAWRDLTYEIELPARILPQEPALLPDGVVMDLDGSDIPTVWRPSTSATAGNGLYSGFMDVWFSPRGTVIGDAAAKGIMHFYVCDSEDSLFLKEQIVASMPGATALVKLQNFDGLIASGSVFIPLDEMNPASVSWLTTTEPYLVKDRRIVTLFAHTGAIAVSNVNAYVGGGGSANPDSNGDGIADDPFLFAETGEEAK